jgi:hypothetical protein
MAFSCDSSLIQVAADNASGVFPFDASKVDPVPEYKPLFDFKGNRPDTGQPNAYLEALARHAEEEEQRKAQAAKVGDGELVNKIERLSNAALLKVLQSVGATDATLVQAAKVGLERVDKLKYFKAINERLAALESKNETDTDDDELPPSLRRKR